MIPVIEQIREEIKLALDEEANTGEMRLLLAQQLDQLHSTIAIASNNPQEALNNFCHDYINAVPDYLTAFYSLSGDTGTSPFCLPFLKLACAYILKPPEILLSGHGLYAFLPKAYLTHRMLEELNDQVLNISGAPLAPVEMSMSNLVVYSLIDQTLADPLDHLVMMAIETTEADRSVFDTSAVGEALRNNRQDKWSHGVKKWPSLTQDFTLQLQI